MKTVETTMKVVIESLGIYLPSRSVTTEEVVLGCHIKLLFPLEKMTGINSRRIAEESEFSIDLAKNATADCLAKSKYRPTDVDLLICCNISRCDGPNFRFSYEPATSIRLRKHFGFSNAVAFDITNACAGMFTAINIAQAFIQAGRARCALIVSGEYITHLTQTAQKEINGFLDPRLACLTLGDAGAAIMLEPSSSDEFGFHEIEMFTLGGYSSYCTAQLTDKGHGAPIMLTDSIKIAAVSIKQGVMHAVELQKRNGWAPNSFDQLILHQTSALTLTDTAREVNRHFNQPICNEENVLSNLAERGNTATTSHFVAMMDAILNGKIESGNNIVFGISGSGLTLGTAIYTFDDLPARIRRMTDGKEIAAKSVPAKILPDNIERAPRVRIESIGTLEGIAETSGQAVGSAKKAAENCLRESSYNRNEIELIIHAGVYREGFISEPALAAIIMGELNINDTEESQRRTLAFDVFNGAIGFLNACHVAIQMIKTKKFKTAMVVTSEIENNATNGQAEIQVSTGSASHPVISGSGSDPVSTGSGTDRVELRGIQETGSALILHQATGNSGFGSFVFRYFDRHIDSFISYVHAENGGARLKLEKEGDFDSFCLKCIPEAVYDLLELEGLDLSEISLILPPQISPKFISQLSDVMGVSLDRFVNVTQGQDLFTSSLPYAMQHVKRNYLAQPGDIGLIICVGTGIQIGCATYYF
ncbi:MAG TPA: 3-oxoacyl-[acyl-carrier-protein] synthase III C-terminal domain-containing protein [Pyrinomonadaceae bacterium]|nr:3-oxoacyl-[acyl-carrier-protein] synthase III C-terminal domain-containing protein [Pyrinomonadaceae bacterium]